MEKKIRKKIYEKKTINRALHVIECPKCGNYCASASERNLLPEWSTCDNPKCNY